MIKHCLLFIFILLARLAPAQELKCNVQVVSQAIQGSNKKVFETLQGAIFEFMNNKIWTNHVYDVEERIECTMLINLTEQTSADQFKGTVQIQARRPVFGSSYYTVMLNYKDDNFDFDYIEFQTLDFNENNYMSNLTSILGYYANIILGMDYDSYSYEGGSEYFQKAQVIVNNAQNATQKGWKAFETSNNKNRYWLIQNIMSEKYAPLREFNYQYHRLGLDLMSTKTTEARSQIAESLKLLQKVYRDKPDPYMHFLQVLIDSESDEWVNIFSESATEEKSQIITLLKEIDPPNTNKYQKILQTN
jgi:hypothetical protein